MIGLDTNVVVRYLAQDDVRQSAVATRLIESLTQDDPGFITTVVLAEIIWVMEDLYLADRDKTAAIVETVLQTQTILVQDAEIAWRALSRFRSGNADFADYLIERTCNGQGCRATYTFDRKAAKASDCGMSLA